VARYGQLSLRFCPASTIDPGQVDQRSCHKHKIHEQVAGTASLVLYGIFGSAAPWLFPAEPKNHHFTVMLMWTNNIVSAVSRTSQQSGKARRY
jgi:hypothetical protein